MITIEQVLGCVFTKKQLQLLEYLSQGYTQIEIAELFGTTTAAIYKQRDRLVIKTHSLTLPELMFKYGVAKQTAHDLVSQQPEPTITDAIKIINFLTRGVRRRKEW